MDCKLEQQLMDQFPWLEAKNVFTDKRLGFPLPCECDDGWYQLIYDCLEEIEQLYKSKNADISELRFYQIKEKYARLMIYMGNYIDGVMDILSKYEDLSAKTCEVCGESGSIRIKGYWIKSLCDKHRDGLGFTDAKKKNKK